MKDESEERSIHRFEAFSDIVIGFSLAQLGVSLAVPAHPSDLFTGNYLWLIAFVWTFALVCSMWWFHHRFFVQLFVPRTLPVLINFVWLAVVVLCVYTAQLSTKDASDAVVWRMYFILFGLAYGLLALQYRICMRIRGPELTPGKREAAVRASAFMHLWTVPFAICAIVVFVLPFGALAGVLIDVAFIGTAIASGIMGRNFRRAMRPSV